MRETQHKGRLTLLGTFRLQAPDGADCPIAGAKQRALVAVLALAPAGRLTHDRAMSLLWSDRGETQARDSLKHAVADLRLRLAALGGDILGVPRDGITLNLTAFDVDTIEVASLCATGTPEAIGTALDLLAGELLDGLVVRDPGFDDWLRIERLRLRSLGETAAGRILREAEEAGGDGAAAQVAQKLLRLDPLREDAVRCLMRHHANQGERTLALRLFEDLGRQLQAELRATPEKATAELAQAIRTRHATVADLSARPEAAAPPRQPPVRPSVAVLPLRNEGGDPEQDYFADGVAEDILTALSHFRWFPVIARNASFAYRDRQPGLREIARELGVRYILDGSVRKIGARVRLTAELVEPETGFQVWGERYDRDLADIFAIQDDLARRVVGAIEPEILRGESQRALTKPPVSLDAYDCHMRGVWFHNLQGGPGEFEQAIRWQRRAIELDPGLARAYMILSRSIYARCLYGYSDDLERDRRDLLDAATRAVALEDRDAYAHYAMCCAHLLNLQPGAAVIDAERATELAPDLALAQNALGWARIFTGRFDEAIGPIEAAMRLSPRDPITYFFNSRLGLAHYHLGNYESAVRYSQRSLYSRPRYFNMLVLLAGFGQLGRTEDAQALMPQIRANEPPDPARFWQFNFPYALPEHRAAIVVGLCKAGYEIAG
jgi:TolB-like protein